ncbi:MAG: ATP-dependent DNA helicase [Methanocellales archaeon]|nr:ATP-dependent DNA helicase [Methanocellales archaeon]MDD4898315.1 ATP-dependent DNA helicase [Methanocellales archaeon]MDD5446319.1 ATP-dependent DNA helicase [Methanocellales archaeon]
MNEGYLRYFPKKSFYPNQKKAMDEIYRALLRREIVLFEGACGTGKTLSSLAPSLHVAKNQDKVVLIATNVHQQMLQFIDEAKEIKNVANIHAIVLKGKLHMCPLKKDYEECNLLRENTYEMIELERFQADAGRMKPLKKRSCEYLANILRDDVTDFFHWLSSDVRTPEEVHEHAVVDGMCGYELLKRSMRDTDLVICNYHHLLNPDILSKLLAWLGRELSDIIVIFDEAHNIESAARSHASLKMTEQFIDKAINEVIDVGVDEEEIYTFLNTLKDTLRETYESRFGFGERERVGTEWYDLRIRDPAGTEDLLSECILQRLPDITELVEKAYVRGKELELMYHNQYKEGLSDTLKTSYVLAVSLFFKDYLKLASEPGYYPLINVRREDGEITSGIELYTCIPKNVTQPLFDSLYSAVLISATLRPFETIKRTLGIQRKTTEISYITPFSKERRHTIAVATLPLFMKNRDDPYILGVIKGVLEDVIEQSDGNVLLFFPNYGEAARYYALLDVNVPMFLDEVGVSPIDIKEKFFEIGESGGKAVLLTYLWGTLTEGIDYKDGRARTVVVIGVGYPALGDKVRAIQYAYDHEFGHGKGWEYAIEIPTIRKVRHAMGRVVRSPDDYGARVLLDGRYTSDSPKILGKYSVFRDFPPEEQAEIVDVGVDKVKYSLMNFFNDIKLLDSNNKRSKIY